MDVPTEQLTFRWADFPPLTVSPGSGGTLRTTPEDFEVDELPLYAPQGSGSHFYARVQKRGLTTRDLVVALLGQGLKEREIGVAGLKDKHALTTQWLSVPHRHAAILTALDDLDGVAVLETSRHKNKLGTGHLQGNRFSVQVREVGPGGLAAARATLAALAAHGVPNYFGPQRFGRFGTNAVDGYKLVRGEQVPGGHRLKRFFVSALQSLLFNHLLARRLELDLFDRVVLGDWAKKHDTGGVFEVKDQAEEERARRFEISATLPLYGKKVVSSAARAGELEAATLENYGLKWEDFRGRHGDRRLSRLPFEGVLTENEAGYRLDFTLPKGAFATSVLREVMKKDIDVAEDDDSSG